MSSFSSLSLSFTKKYSYGAGTECNKDCTGTVAAQKHPGTVITLADADETFGDTMSTAGGASYKGLSLSEGGKAWTIQEMDIPSIQ